MKAEWSYKTGSAQGDVLGYNGDRIEIAHPSGESVIWLEPERLDNWHAVQQYLNGGDWDFMNLPAYSRNGKNWKAFDKDGNLLSSHDTHSELKDKYSVHRAVGAESGEFDYKLLYNPAEVE